MICPYIYTLGGLRVESGSAYINATIDGQDMQLKIIRDGKGRSRLEKGEISLSDLSEMFPDQEYLQITVKHNGVDIPLMLDPENAMGRSGRESIKDLHDVVSSLNPVARKILAELQIENTPEGVENPHEALERTKWALGQADHLRVSDDALLNISALLDKEASATLLERHNNLASKLALQLASGTAPGLMVTVSQDLKETLIESGYLDEAGSIPALRGHGLTPWDIEDLALADTVIDAKYGAIVNDVPLSVWKALKSEGFTSFSSMTSAAVSRKSEPLLDRDGKEMMLEGSVWDTQDGRVVFGAHPDSVWPDGVKALARNPYEISGLSPHSKEGRDLAVEYTAAIAAVTEAEMRCLEYSAGRCNSDGRCLECFTDPLSKLRHVARDLTGFSSGRDNPDTTIVDALLYRASRGDEEAARDFKTLADLGERMVDLIKYPDVRAGITPRMKEDLVATGYMSYKIKDSMQADALATWRDEQMGRVFQELVRGNITPEWASHLREEVIKWSSETGWGNKYRDTVAQAIHNTSETFDSQTGGLRTADLGTEHLYLVHETAYEPQRDEEGNVCLRPTGDFNERYPRSSIHFTVNHTAAGHMFRQGDDAKHAVVVRLSDVLERNPQSLDSLYAIDTYLSPMPGEALVLPAHATRVIDLDSVSGSASESDTERQASRTRRVFKEINDIHSSLTGDQNASIPVFPSGTHYSSSQVDSRLRELASHLGATTGIHQNHSSSRFEKIPPLDELSHFSFHDTSFSAGDLADLSPAARARMMTHGRWPGVSARPVKDPNEDSIV